MVKVTQTVNWNGTQVPVYHMETIDFGRLLSQEPAELEKLVQCCQEEGYFYLDLQGIDGRRMLEDEQETLSLMNRFFSQPLEAKNEFGLVSAHLGYEPVGSRTGVLQDTKDGYEMIKVSTWRLHGASRHFSAHFLEKNAKHMVPRLTYSTRRYPATKSRGPTPIFQPS